MVMTIVQMAAKVLEEEKRALTVWEIWLAAKSKGYDKLVDSKGNTAFDPLGGSIHADISINPLSVFVALGESPTRFILKKHIDDIQPGKKVRILENIHYSIGDLDIGEVIATKGSIGTILSYREWVCSGMKARIHYPVRFDEVMPLSDDDYATIIQYYSSVAVTCRVGITMILPGESFAVI